MTLVKMCLLCCNLVIHVDTNLPIYYSCLADRAIFIFEFNTYHFQVVLLRHVRDCNPCYGTCGASRKNNDMESLWEYDSILWSTNEKTYDPNFYCNCEILNVRVDELSKILKVKQKQQWQLQLMKNETKLEK